MNDDGAWAMILVWVFQAVLLVFLLLRLYTRTFLRANLGVDDYLYIAAFILASLSAALLEISAVHGWGETFESLIMAGRAAEIATAALWLMIASTVSTATMALAKLSLGALLLRLMAVTMRWQRITVWVVMVAMVALSIIQVFVFWLGCEPSSYIWNRQQPGSCSDIIKVYPYILYPYTVMVDLTFAFLPWTFIPQLNMPRGEKYLVAGTMSLGVLAGACGIKRIIELPGFWGEEILKESVQTVVWSAVEIDLTLLCIAVPVILPLFRSCITGGRRRIYSRHGYQKQSDKPSSGKHSDQPRSSDDPQIALRTFGGGSMARPDSAMLA